MYEKRKAIDNPNMLEMYKDLVIKYINKKATVICITVEIIPTIPYLKNLILKIAEILLVINIEVSFLIFIVNDVRWASFRFHINSSDIFT